MAETTPYTELYFQDDVRVTALCPGFTYSEFHDVNGMRESISKLPKALWLTSEQVAKIGVDGGTVTIGAGVSLADSHSKGPT